ncbi:MAG: ABC transporter permease [Acidobacteriota bacterium]
MNDIRFALRQLRRRPAFTATILLTLALGIGANTAVFSVINAILLAPLPYRQADRLVEVFQTMRDRDEGVLDLSVPTYLSLRERNRSFDDMAAFERNAVTLTGTGDPMRISCFSVSPHFWDVLGVSAGKGRLFKTDQDRPGENAVVVLDYGFWRGRFNGDERVIGQSIQLDQRSFTVVGILPEDFRFHAPPRYPRVDAFVPLDEQAAAKAPRDSGGFEVIGRLKPGITPAAAREDLERVSAGLAKDYREYEGLKWVPQSLSQVLFGEVRPALMIVLAAVGCVLLVACVNVAGLLLVWHLRRRAEIHVRMALGASRFRLLRQFIAECFLLTLVGAGLGLLLAQGTTRFLADFIPRYIPVGGTVGLNGRVLLFALGTSLVTSLVFGAVMALPRRGPDLSQGLAEGGSRLTGGRSVRRLQRGLVVAELSIAFVLTICAVLLVQTFAGLMAVDPGFNPRHLLATRIELPAGKADQGRAATFFADLRQEIQRLPGVEGVTIGSSLPMRGPHSGTYFDLPGRPLPDGQHRAEFVQVVSPGYFEVMGTPLETGRDFAETDRGEAPLVIIVNRLFAQKYWPGEDPLGKRIMRFGRSWEVIGVASEIREFELLGEVPPVPPLIYFAHAQDPRRGMQVFVRTAGSPAALTAALRREISRLDPNLPVGTVVSMEQVLTESVWSRRALAILTCGFGVLALVLAVTGVYAHIAYAVTQRTREFGIRVALGAGRRDLVASVLRDGLKMTLLSIVIGLAAAAGTTRLIAGTLYGVSPLDPATFLGGALVTIAVAVLACWIPARRASRVDPIRTLREE